MRELFSSFPRPLPCCRIRRTKLRARMQSFMLLVVTPSCRRDSTNVPCMTFQLRYDSMSTIHLIMVLEGIVCCNWTKSMRLFRSSSERFIWMPQTVTFIWIGLWCMLDWRIILYELCLIQNAIEDYNSALKYLKETNAQFKAHFHMGNCYRQIKKYDKSIEHL